MTDDHRMPAPADIRLRVLAGLHRAARASVLRPLHHEYSRLTPWPIHLVHIGVLVAALVAIPWMAVASGEPLGLGAIAMFAALTASASSLYVHRHDDALVTFTELFFALSFVALEPRAAACVILAVAVWTAATSSASILGGIGHAASTVVDAGLGLLAAIGAGELAGALGAGSAITVLAQVSAAVVAMNLGIVVSGIPYALFATRDQRAILNPFSPRDACTEALLTMVSQAPTAVIAAFAVREATWLAALAIVPLLYSWWATQRARAVDEANRRANTDPLTGLLNRRGLQEAAAPRIEARGEHALIVLGDVDGFKQVNDTLGHAAGDEVLRTIADILERATRGADRVAARYGGEEFVVVHFGATVQSVLEWAEDVRAEVHDALRDLGSGISLGISERNGGGDTLEAALSRADMAMYAAKGAGKNRVVTHVEGHETEPSPVPRRAVPDAPSHLAA